MEVYVHLNVSVTMFHGVIPQKMLIFLNPHIILSGNITVHYVEKNRQRKDIM
jgi:hypothetical protein